MINHETAVKLQAYLDGELSPPEARAIGELVAGDESARSLCEELKAMSELLATNEPDLKVPESRDFYWSKIRRQIESEERAEARGTPSWWVRFVAPAGALAGLAMFVAVALRNSGPPSEEIALGDSHEIVTPLEETSSFSFRSEATGMTVVWVDSHRFE